MLKVAQQVLGKPDGRDNLPGRKFLSRVNLATQDFGGQLRGKYLPLGVIRLLEAQNVADGDVLYCIDAVERDSTPAGTHDGIRDGASSSSAHFAS